jgi:hypothetical protein
MTSAGTNDKSGTVAEQGANVASEKASSKKAATRKKGAREGHTAAKGRKTKAAKPARAKEASTTRAESKGAKILAMIGRAKGATLAEIMKAVAWQAHSVRGYLSTAAKKQHIKIESAKDESGARVYRIAK